MAHGKKHRVKREEGDAQVVDGSQDGEDDLKRPFISKNSKSAKHTQAATAQSSFCTMKNTLFIIILAGGLVAICLAFAVLLTTSESNGGGMTHMGSNFGFLAMIIVGGLMMIMGSILWIVDVCCVNVKPSEPPVTQGDYDEESNGGQ
jgi:hypothetical protein